MFNARGRLRLPDPLEFGVRMNALRSLTALAVPVLLSCSSSCGTSPAADGGLPDSGGPPSLAAGPDAAALPALGCLPVKAWAAPAAKAPLAVTPKFLWRKKLLPYDLTAITGLVVRSGKQIAFSYHQLYVFDLSGNPVWETRYPGAHFSSGGVVADSDGNYYQFADQLYSYFPDGRLRWSKTYPNMFRGADTFAYAPIVRGNTDLFFRSSDGKLRRVDAKTGKTIWERDLPREPLAITAFGGHIFDYVGHAWNSETGDGFSVAIDGSPFVPFAVLPDGNVWGAVGRLGSYGKARLTLVNSCLAPLRASSDRVLAVPGPFDYAQRIWESSIVGNHYVYRPLSVTENGPDSTMAARPVLAGADGTLYTSQLAAAVDGGVRATLFGYSADQVETTKVEFEGRVGLEGGSTIDSDGVLYSVALEKDGVYMLAVQTRSPGLSEMPLGTLLEDERRTGWPKDHL